MQGGREHSLTSRDVSYQERLPDICFDPDNIMLEGSYSNEILAYRAKRGWKTTLETFFLLEHGDDFELSVIRHPDHNYFLVHCGFFSACARYAFWRLTNEQAPEAQYRIETAHIPNGESAYGEFMASPDLRPAKDGPLLLQGWGSTPEFNQKWFSKLIQLIGQLKSVKK